MITSCIGAMKNKNILVERNKNHGHNQQYLLKYNKNDS